MCLNERQSAVVISELIIVSVSVEKYDKAIPGKLGTEQSASSNKVVTKVFIFTFCG